MKMDQLSITPISLSKKDIKKFVAVAWQIYENNPWWVPPLISEQADYIRKGPYHDSGVIQPFIAYRDGRPAGRIIAHYDRDYNKKFGRNRGCFGFFESIDDTSVSRALFDACRKWLLDQGMTEMCGPLNFTMYDATGVLMSDFESDPVLELAYNPPYYADLFSDGGFEKVVDWYAYRFTRDQEVPAVLYKARDRVLANRDGIRFHHADMKRFWKDAPRMLKVFNRAWEDNWDHMPLTDRQFNYFAGALKSIVKPELVLYAEKDDQLVGYILTVPDINPALKAANGRLFPFGLVKMLWKFRTIKRVKVFMLGVLPEYRGRMIEAYFILETYERAKKMGYAEADISLVVETNKAMIGVLDRAGAERYKTFRIFGKALET